jgi:hypothetical protein
MPSIVITAQDAEIGARQPVARERPPQRRAAQRLQHRPGFPFGDGVLRTPRQRRERTGRRLPAADGVVLLLAPGPPSRERLGRIGGRDGDDVDRLGREAGVREAGVDGLRGEPDFELAPRQPLFVDGEAKTAILQKRGA